MTDAFFSGFLRDKKVLPTAGVAKLEGPASDSWHSLLLEHIKWQLCRVQLPTLQPQPSMLWLVKRDFCVGNLFARPIRSSSSCIRRTMHLETPLAHTTDLVF